MISIQVHCHGSIDRHGHRRDRLVVCTEDATISSFLEQFGYPALQLLSIIAMMHGLRMPMNQDLFGGDVLDILAPAGGG